MLIPLSRSRTRTIPGGAGEPLALAQGSEPVSVDAVDSLCRVGTDPVLPGNDIEHVRVWLVDSQGENANPHYVLDQAARQVLRLREEGKRVLLHRLAGQSRTPAVAALYSCLATGTDSASASALNDLREALHAGWTLPYHPEMQEAVHELTAGYAAPGRAASERAVPSQDTAAGQRQELLDSEPVEPTQFVRRKDAVSRVRGMMLGLALGDTLGAAGGKLPDEGPLQAGVSTQLACFTAEGTIRAWVRGQLRGVCHPPSVVWHACSRWMALQGLEVERMRKRWADSAELWPDGWLARVPALAERRGSAPSTVKALSKIEQGSPTASRGCHALTRTLPVAVVHAAEGLGTSAELAREIAGLTHGDQAAQSATVHAVVLVGHCLTHADESAHNRRGGAREALRAGIRALVKSDGRLTGHELDQLETALQSAEAHPVEPGRLAKLAPDVTAPSALLGGLYVAASFPGRDQVAAALRFAARAPDGDSVACVTGALLGAAHGFEALPVDLVSRHELAWVLHRMAGDLFTQFADSPAGYEYSSGWDPYWSERYPGWCAITRQHRVEHARPGRSRTQPGTVRISQAPLLGQHPHQFVLPGLEYCGGPFTVLEYLAGQSERDHSPTTGEVLGLLEGEIVILRR